MTQLRGLVCCVSACLFLSAMVLLGSCSGGNAAVTGGGSGSGGSGGSGSGGSGSSGGSGLTAGGATSAYVIQQPYGAAGSVLQLSLAKTNIVTPMSTLTMPPGFTISALATDESGEIYVGGIGDNGQTAEVLVYAAGASGAATPVRTLQGGTAFDSPQSMIVDGTGQLYIAGPYEIAVFAANASGTATPIRQIVGALTQIPSVVRGIAVDSTGGIYVTVATSTTIDATGSIVVFSGTANGNVAPGRVIAGNSGENFWGVAVDDSDNVYVVVNGDYAAASLVEYGAGTSTVIASSGDLAYGVIDAGGGLRRDSAGNFYSLGANVTNGIFAQPASYTLVAFGPKIASATPVLQISSTAWMDAGSEIALH